MISDLGKIIAATPCDGVKFRIIDRPLVNVTGSQRAVYIEQVSAVPDWSIAAGAHGYMRPVYRLSIRYGAAQKADAENDQVLLSRHLEQPAALTGYAIRTLRIRESQVISDPETGANELQMTLETLRRS